MSQRLLLRCKLTQSIVRGARATDEGLRAVIDVSNDLCELVRKRILAMMTAVQKKSLVSPKISNVRASERCVGLKGVI